MWSKKNHTSKVTSEATGSGDGVKREKKTKQKRGENNTSTRNYPKEKKKIIRQQWKKNVFSSQKTKEEELSGEDV